MRLHYPDGRKPSQVTVKAAIDALYAPDKVSRACVHRSSDHKSGLQTQSGKAPSLFLTEFGYKNQRASGEDVESFQTEATRRFWLVGSPQTKTKHRKIGALDRAAATARWLVYYHPVEVKPDTQGIYAFGSNGWDSGLIDEPTCHSSPQARPFDCSYAYQVSPNADIIGFRHYGRRSQRKTDFIPSNVNITRAAYCGIRNWAFGLHYPGAAACPTSG